MTDQLDLFLAPPPNMLKGIFIPGNVPSLKNNKEIITIRPKVGKPRYTLVPSKRHQKYAKQSEGHYLFHKQAFRNAVRDIPKPRRIAFQFVKETKIRFDLTNAAETVLDLLVKHGWLEDDNASEVIPVFCPALYSKERPGVVICPLR